MPPLFSECTAPLAIGLPTGLTAATPMQNVLALARTTFSSLQRTAAEDIVILGNGAHCPAGPRYCCFQTGYVPTGTGLGGLHGSH
ncbi:hypothetical protein F5888DRAFT_1676626 [Russula emetica]|nr:hypothetical protein F5888DRAFT_1676626 [Russula emetica]